VLCCCDLPKPNFLCVLIDIFPFSVLTLFIFYSLEAMHSFETVKLNNVSVVLFFMFGFATFVCLYVLIKATMNILMRVKLANVSVLIFNSLVVLDMFCFVQIDYVPYVWSYWLYLFLMFAGGMYGIDFCRRAFWECYVEPLIWLHEMSWQAQSVIACSVYLCPVCVVPCCIGAFCVYLARLNQAERDAFIEIR
jgi:hypothetical protein